MKWRPRGWLNKQAHGVNRQRRVQQRRGERSEHLAEGGSLSRFELAGQRHGKSPLLHHVGITPLREQRLLPRGQVAAAPTRHVAWSQRRTKRVELLHAGVREAGKLG